MITETKTREVKDEFGKTKRIRVTRKTQQEGSN